MITSLDTSKATLPIFCINLSGSSPKLSSAESIEEIKLARDGADLFQINRLYAKLGCNV
ncbi:hypothetical protein [Borreliella andersonii]|uniref:hypothetical protein n=1 Tax=Borrelia andersonii TaxID=42109 RepID=UPI003B9F7684